jgi:hypothetical protein
MGENLLEDLSVVVLEVNERPLLQRMDAGKRVPCSLTTNSPTFSSSGFRWGKIHQFSAFVERD